MYTYIYIYIYKYAYIIILFILFIFAAAGPLRGGDDGPPGLPGDPLRGRQQLVSYRLTHIYVYNT